MRFRHKFSSVVNQVPIFLSEERRKLEVDRIFAIIGALLNLGLAQRFNFAANPRSEIFGKTKLFYWITLQKRQDGPEDTTSPAVFSLQTGSFRGSKVVTRPQAASKQSLTCPVGLLRYLDLPSSTFNGLRHGRFIVLLGVFTRAPQICSNWII